jgi:hypothetical protein
VRTDAVTGEVIDFQPALVSAHSDAANLRYLRVFSKYAFADGGILLAPDENKILCVALLAGAAGVLTGGGREATQVQCNGDHQARFAGAALGSSRTHHGWVAVRTLKRRVRSPRGTSVARKTCFRPRA